MERKALGRGLASLIPTREEAETAAPAWSEGNAAAVRQIPVGEIVANPTQPRKFFDGKKIEELAQSIREKGILVPLIVSHRDGRYELISGERRLRAASLAGLVKVPALIREVDEPERLELGLIENIQREDLGPIEEASAYEVLIERFGYTQEQVADRVGRDRATVANFLRLLKLPSKIKQVLQSGQITMGHARALLGVPEIEKQLYFVGKIVEEGWSVRELEVRIAARRMIGLKNRVKPLAPHLVQILDEMRRVLGTQVRLIPGGSKKNRLTGRQGKILIEYYSEDDLNRIYTILVKQAG